MLKYENGLNEMKNWIVTENEFNVSLLGKCETIMALGNGYLGIRSTTEENYLQQTRNMFVNGTFNRFSEEEVSELPNFPDMIEMEMHLDGYRLDLEQMEVVNYEREMNLKAGLLTRYVTVKLPNSKVVSLTFRRFTSLANLHLFGSKIVIKTEEDVTVKIKSGINGRVSNSGTQHFLEGDKRFYEKKYMQSNITTTQSGISATLNTVHKLSTEDFRSEMSIERRQIEQILEFNVCGSVELEKLSTIYTEIDKELDGKSFDEIKVVAFEDLKSAYEIGFDELQKESASKWLNDVWAKYPIQIDSTNQFDQLAIRFAIYHLTIMTPAHDCRMGIGAKGLTGEGYKGHSFWDTEVFILPFYIYSNPEVARTLLEYRYLGLEGARKKANENGFLGAMYPWEAAWPSDGEVTPVWGAVDIITGERTKIWSGFIEQHITSDIAMAVWQYYIITNDQEFMDSYGYEILFDTAIFWSSRFEYNAQLDRYEITDVVGPDEYKEHVDNNAFTNYTAVHNIKLAKKYYEEIKETRPEIFAKLNMKLNLDDQISIWEDRIQKAYLPVPNEELIIPQDDTYLQKEIIDLEPYKNQEHVGSLFKVYNLEQVGEMQVSKQADIMILFYLLEDLFSQEVKVANYNYYEPKTLHDSSLSLSTHSILASDLELKDKAYDLFTKACEIDLGPNMKTSDHGIHAASLGGIWQCIVMGFAGVRMLNETLRINPKLPTHWNSVSFNMYWQGSLLEVYINKDSIKLNTESSNEIKLQVFGTGYSFAKNIKIGY